MTALSRPIGRLSYWLLCLLLVGQQIAVESLITSTKRSELVPLGARKTARMLLQASSILRPASSTAGLPPNVTLVPQSPGIGSVWLNSPNVSATRAYVCKESSYIVSLTILNATISNKVLDDAPSTISYIQGNCSDGTVLPEFTVSPGSSGYMKYCSPLGYPNGYNLYAINYTGSLLGSLARNLTYRESRAIYQLAGQGSSNGTLASTACPPAQVFVGYAGMETCEGVNLLQLACASLTGSKGSFDSKQPFFLDTQISQQFVDAPLPSGVDLKLLGGTGTPGPSDPQNLATPSSSQPPVSSPPVSSALVEAPPDLAAANSPVSNGTNSLLCTYAGICK